MSYELEPFTYNGVDFTGYAEYSLAKDTIEYTLYSRHSLSKVKYRNDWEIAVDCETKEETDKFLEENLRVFPEHGKAEMFENMLFEFEDAWALLVFANINMYTNKYGSTHKNEWWPIMTKESVAEYYEKRGIEPVLNFDGSYNKNSFSVDPMPEV